MSEVTFCWVGVTVVSSLVKTGFWMSTLTCPSKALCCALYPSGLLRLSFLLNDFFIASACSTTGASRFPLELRRAGGKCGSIKNWHVLAAQFSREFLLHRVFDNIENSICSSFCFVCCFVEILLLVLCQHVEVYWGQQLALSLPSLPYLKYWNTPWIKTSHIPGQCHIRDNFTYLKILTYMKQKVLMQIKGKC